MHFKACVSALFTSMMAIMLAAPVIASDTLPLLAPATLSTRDEKPAPEDPESAAHWLSQQPLPVTELEARLLILISQHPTSPALRFAQGNLFARQSRWHEALQAYQQALLAAPNNPLYLFNQAVTLEHLRRPQAARLSYQHALRHYTNESGIPNPGYLRDRIAQLSTIQADEARIP